MEELNYKDEIRSSRTGSLGSSDGKVLYQIAELGQVPKSAYKRLAVCKGLIEQTEIPRTAAIRTGDEIEMAIYEHLKAGDERYQSNPLLVSKRYSRSNVKLISHIDFMLKDDETKTLFLYEAKATRYTFNQTRNTYKAQLYVHYLLGTEMASELGKDWNMKLFLVHYSTEGLDLENDGCEFDPERLTVKPLRMPKSLFDMGKAMDIVSAFLEGFNEFYEAEEVDAELLPEAVHNQFTEVAGFLREIKEREAKVEAFKAKLYDFLMERGIKKVSCDDFSFTVVAPTQAVSFDHKKFLEDYAISHPKKAKKLKEQYKKTSNKKGFVQIKVNTKKED